MTTDGALDSHESGRPGRKTPTVVIANQTMNASNSTPPSGESVTDESTASENTSDSLQHARQAEVRMLLQSNADVLADRLTSLHADVRSGDVTTEEAAETMREVEAQLHVLQRLVSDE